MPHKHALPALMAMASSAVLIATVAMGLMFEDTGDGLADDSKVCAQGAQRDASMCSQSSLVSVLGLGH